MVKAASYRVTTIVLFGILIVVVDGTASPFPWATILRRTFSAVIRNRCMLLAGWQIGMCDDE
jgi:hypothetical protein